MNKTITGSAIINLDFTKLILHGFDVIVNSDNQISKLVKKGLIYTISLSGLLSSILVGALQQGLWLYKTIKGFGVETIDNRSFRIGAYEISINTIPSKPVMILDSAEALPVITLQQNSENIVIETSPTSISLEK